VCGGGERLIDGEPQARETPDRDGAFPRLSPEQIELLSADGQRMPTREGDVLVRQGYPYEHFFIVLAGLVAMLDGDEHSARVISLHGPGRFLGELSLLTGQAAFATAVVREPGEALAVPVPRLRELVAENRGLGDLILHAYLMRREHLIGAGAGLRIVGSLHSPDTARLRDFAARNRLPHRWIDVDSDAEAEALLRCLGVAPEETPVVIWRGRDVLRNPTNAELAQAVGLRAPRTERADWDLVVVGAGPAGLGASVYAASEGLRTVTVDAEATGGQAGRTSRIENYLGFPAGISGGELAERAVLQADKFGARMVVPASAVGSEWDGHHHVVHLDDGGTLTSRAVLIATGVRYRRITVPGLERLEPACVFYAATPSEARICLAKPVAVVGGGNSAGQAAMFLADYATEVYLIARERDLSDYMSRYLIDRVERSRRVRTLLHTEIRELIGDETLEAAIVEDVDTGERRRLELAELFVFCGALPYTGWLAGEIALDDGGYVLTGAGAGAGDGDGRQPLPLETSRPGVFAAGDVRHGAVRRVASAVGEGGMVVRQVHERMRPS
jgi:thioredoxin reductase (NADPH)